MEQLNTVLEAKTDSFPILSVAEPNLLSPEHNVDSNSSNDNIRDDFCNGFNEDELKVLEELCDDNDNENNDIKQTEIEPITSSHNNIAIDLGLFLKLDMKLVEQRLSEIRKSQSNNGIVDSNNESIKKIPVKNRLGEKVPEEPVTNESLKISIQNKRSPSTEKKISKSDPKESPSPHRNSRSISNKGHDRQHISPVRRDSTKTKNTFRSRSRSPYYAIKPRIRRGNYRRSRSRSLKRRDRSRSMNRSPKKRRYYRSRSSSRSRTKRNWRSRSKSLNRRRRTRSNSRSRSLGKRSKNNRSRSSSLSSRKTRKQKTSNDNSTNDEKTKSNPTKDVSTKSSPTEEKLQSSKSSSRSLDTWERGSSVESLKSAVDNKRKHIQEELNLIEVMLNQIRKKKTGSIEKICESPSSPEDGEIKKTDMEVYEKSKEFLDLEPPPPPVISEKNSFIYNLFSDLEKVETVDLEERVQDVFNFLQENTNESILKNVLQKFKTFTEIFTASLIQEEKHEEPVLPTKTESPTEDHNPVLNIVVDTKDIKPSTKNSSSVEQLQKYINLYQSKFVKKKIKIEQAEKEAKKLKVILDNLGAKSSRSGVRNSTPARVSSRKSHKNKSIEKETPQEISITSMYTQDVTYDIFDVNNPIISRIVQSIETNSIKHSKSSDVSRFILQEEDEESPISRQFESPLLQMCKQFDFMTRVSCHTNSKIDYKFNDTDAMSSSVQQCKSDTTKLVFDSNIQCDIISMTDEKIHSLENELSKMQKSYEDCKHKNKNLDTLNKNLMTVLVEMKLKEKIDPCELAQTIESLKKNVQELETKNDELRREVSMKNNKLFMLDLELNSLKKLKQKT